MGPFKEITRISVKQITKDDWVKVCSRVNEMEADYWRLDGLMEAEIERIVINVGLKDSDEELNLPIKVGGDDGGSSSTVYIFIFAC
jgi:hypothetical protein